MLARGWVCASRTAWHPLKWRKGVSLRRSLAAQVQVEDAQAPRATSEKVTKLADEILELNLLEIADLSNLLKDKLGLDAVPMGMPMAAAPMAAAPGAAPAEAAPEVEEKTSFDIKLESFEASSKIKVIKEIRAITELGLKEAKELVEKSPVVVKENVDKKEAEEMKKKLEEVGAVVVLS